MQNADNDAKVDTGDIAPTKAVKDGDPEQARLEALIDMIEADRVGLRLDRFVGIEREALAARLSEEQFNLTMQQTFRWPELFDRVQLYDAVILPYVEFFAVGCTYTPVEHAGIWSEFLQRLASCNAPDAGGYNEALRRLTFYPILLLLYGAGMVSMAKGRLFTLKTVLEAGISDQYGSGDIPLIMRINSFNVMDEQGQKAIPERERQHTPLLNHMYAVLAPALKLYFPTEALYARAWTRFETVLIAAYSHTDREIDTAAGRQDDRYWAPPSRVGWMDMGHGQAVGAIIIEARRLGDKWPPAVAGLFSGDTETFIKIVEELRSGFSRRFF